MNLHDGNLKWKHLAFPLVGANSWCIDTTGAELEWAVKGELPTVLISGEPPPNATAFMGEKMFSPMLNPVCRQDHLLYQKPSDR